MLTSPTTSSGRTRSTLEQNEASFSSREKAPSPNQVKLQRVGDALESLRDALTTNLNQNELKIESLTEVRQQTGAFSSGR